MTKRGFLERDGVIWNVPPRPYGVSYRSLIPKKEECANLLVPVCLSATHAAHGSIRMEPVFMVLGQTSATAAIMAIDAGTSVQKIEYPKLRERLQAIWDRSTSAFVRENVAPFIAMTPETFSGVYASAAKETNS